MQFTPEEIVTLNTYFNSCAELPVDVLAVNDKIRAFLRQDLSTEPEVVDTPVEQAPVDPAPVDTVPVDTPAADTSVTQ